MLSAFVLALVLQVPPAQVSPDPVPPSVADLVPGTLYDASVPTLEQVVGHDFGEEITAPDDVVRYFEALAEAAPERTRLIRYGESWEGRPLIALVIGTPERIQRLPEIQAGLQRLADPRGLSGAEAERLVAELPVVTALLHGIHGNEISSTGAAMAEAYHLLAAQGDPTVERIFAESLVLIDPVENPDGRARFVHSTVQGRGRWPDADPASIEHDEPWPGGRANHYLFDLNRDLFIQSQPESRARAGLYFDFWPHVVVDLHEMGGNATYFFPPTAPPFNPWYGERLEELMGVFGGGIADAFDRRGFAYFNRDVYDAFYPGYMDMWPMGHGSLGMTFEQGSARGLLFRRADGDVLTYGEGVLHHFTSAIATAGTAAANRETILRDFLAFRRQGMELGEAGPAEYVLHSAHDPGMAERLARMLVRNGIEVHEAGGPVEVDGRTLPAEGTYVVPLAQPDHRFARNLLDPHVPMDEAFVQRQIELRAERLPDEIYDLTAWSQSLLWDVEVIPAEEPTGAAGPRVEAEGYGFDAALAAPPSATLPAAGVGYLLPWGTAAAATVAEALQAGIRVRAAGAPFQLEGRDYGVGTAIVRLSENADDLRQRLGAIAARHGAEVVPIDGTYVESGTSLGASSTRALRAPRVLLLWGDPASSLSAGFARYVLEQRYGVRTTAVRPGSLGRVTLSDYDVIVAPSGNYGAGTAEDLQAWMAGGGTLITLAEATRWAASNELLSTAAERRSGGGGGAGDDPIDYLDAIVPEDEAPESVPGAILRAVFDTTHWLAAGTDGEMGVLVEGSRVFTPLTLDNGTNVGRYGELDDLVLSGTVWEEARPQLASKAFLMHEGVGGGQIVAFAEDPNYRAYTEATQLLFINAVLLGPGR